MKNNKTNKFNYFAKKMNPPKFTNQPNSSNFNVFNPFKLEKLNKTVVVDSNEDSQKIFPKYASISSTKNYELVKTYQLSNSNHIRRHDIKKANNKQHQQMEIKTSFLTFVNTNAKIGKIIDTARENESKKDLNRTEISILDERRRLQRLVNQQLEDSKLMKKTLAHREKIAKLEENIQKNIDRISELRQRLYELGNSLQPIAQFDQDKLVYRKFW
jgi:hypothetical protein